MKALWVALVCGFLGVTLLVVGSGGASKSAEDFISLQGAESSLTLAQNDVCHTTCLTCSGPGASMCLSCNSTGKLTYLDSTGKCVKVCPSYFYNDPSIGKKCMAACPSNTAANTYKECVPCHSSCVTCTGGLNSQCLTCSQTGLTPYITYDHKCVNDCPPRTFRWTNAGVKECRFVCVGGIYNSGEDADCHLCHPSCTECINSKATDCIACSIIGAHPFLYNRQCLTTCPPGTYKYDNPAGFKECRDTCGSAYFLDAASKYCVACDKSCQTCSDVALCTACNPTGTTPYLSQNQCLAQCPAGSFSYVDAAGKRQCRSTCGDGFYAESGLCSACDSSCLTCSGKAATACLSCDQAGPNPIFLNGICSKSCPAGTYMHENSQGFQDCVTSCGDGFALVAGTNQCVDCNPSCATCSGAAAGQCITCKQTGQSLYMNAGHCLADCPTPLLKIDRSGVKECVVKCDGTYWLDATSKTCFPCAPTCQSCKGAHSSDCLSCPSSFQYFHESQCLADCPAGLYKSLVKGVWTCIAQCEPGFGLDAANTCQSCDSSCSLCSSPTQCTACSPTGATPYLSGSLCLAVCPETTFKFTDGKGLLQCRDTCGSGFYVDSTATCLPCASTCLTCDLNGCLSCDQAGPNPFFSLNMCLSACVSPAYHFNSASGKVCVDTCSPAGFYVNTASNYCSPCDPSCSTCQCAAKDGCLTCDQAGLYPFFSLGNCLSECPTGTYRYTDEAGNSQCRSTCGTSYYLDMATQWCYRCFGACLECSSVEANGCTACLQAGATPYFSAGQCLSECPSGLFQYKNPAGYQQCIETCGDGFAIIGQTICEKCHFSCQTCSGPTANECLQCEVNGQFPYAMENQCLRSCPKDTFHLVMASGFKGCVASCQSKYFVDPNSNTCLICHQTCGSCSGPDQYQCTTCDLSGSFPYALDGECLASCPPDTSIDQKSGVQICKRTCKDGSAYVPSTNKCEKCHSSCATCSSPADTSCLTCTEARPLWSAGKCVTTCPGTAVKFMDSQGWKECIADCGVGFIVETDGYCRACHQTCEQCASTSKSACTLCDSKGNFPFLVANQCLASCPAGTSKFENANGAKTCKSVCGDGFVLNPETGYCLKCEGKCQSCALSDQSQCLSCSYFSSYPFLVGTACAAYCPAGQYQMDDQAKEKKTCVKSCGEGFYVDTVTNYCSHCHSTCLSCSGPGAEECLACEDLTNEQYLFHGSCLAACPDGFTGEKGSNSRYCKSMCENGYYYDAPSAQCGVCPSSCLTCSSSSTCNSCAPASPFKYQGNCLEACPEGMYGLEESDGKICVESCAAGFAVQSTMCSPCHSSCLTCGTPGDEQQCASCRPAGKYPFLAAGRCIAGCQLPLVQYRVGTMLQCLVECPIGTFKYTTGTQATCSVGCPEGYYPDSSSQTCEPCHSSCLSCSSPQASSCLSCALATPYIAANSTCLVACSKPYYSLSNVDGSRCVDSCPKLHYNKDGYRYCVDVCMEDYYRVGWQCFTKEQTLQWGYYILIFLLVLLVAGCIYGGFRLYKKYVKKHNRKSSSSSSDDELKQRLIPPPSD